jgi:hypothetical protein
VRQPLFCIGSERQSRGMVTDRGRLCATDLPEPASPDVVAAGFPVPLITRAAVAPPSYALLFGLVQVLRRRRGDRAHRLIGWTWTTAI